MDNMLGDPNATFEVFWTFEGAQDFLELFNLVVEDGQRSSDGVQYWFAHDMIEGSDDNPDPRHPDTLVAFCDGSALGNGQNYCVGGAACIFPHDRRFDHATSLDWPTSNRSEYLAAVMALHRANVQDPSQHNVMYIFSDSKAGRIDEQVDLQVGAQRLEKCKGQRGQEPRPLGGDRGRSRQPPSALVPRESSYQQARLGVALERDRRRQGTRGGSHQLRQQLLKPLP